MRKNRGFTLLELLIVVVILGVLALIAAPTLLNAADRAKEGAVKANVSAAASTVTTRLAVEEENGETAANVAVNQLNSAGTDDTADDAKSPFASQTEDIAAFVEAATGDKGQTALEGVDYEVTIRGFGKQGSDQDPIAAKTVKAPQESSSATSGT